MPNDNVTGTFPILETERLLLRELVTTDVAVLYPYWTDPAVTEYFTLEPFKSIEEAQGMVTLLAGLYEANQGIRWAITRKSDQTVLGTCGFHNIKPEHYRAELGYELGKTYWGQGFMAEALKAIMEYGFNTFNYNRIEAFVNLGNVRSTRILEKMGFRLDGLLRQYEFARGQFVDQYCYSALKSDH